MQDEEIVPVPVVSIEHLDFIKETRIILEEVKKNKDFETGFDFINQLHEKGRSFATAIGIMLEGMELIWVPSEHEGESFRAAAVRNTDLSPVTIQRHIKIQKALESDVIPEVFRDDISSMGQKSLISIAELVVSGVEMTHKDWKELADAADEREVGRVVRKIKKVAPRSNYLAITIDERGVLFAHTSTEHVEIGRFNVGSKNPVVQKAIERLRGCGGILEKVDY